jgi:hypothetical protein
MPDRKSKTLSYRRLMISTGIILGCVLLLVAASYAATNLWPNLGAGAVDLGRRVFGDRIISQVENFILGLEDNLKQIQYRLLKTKPDPPWVASTDLPAFESDAAHPTDQPKPFSTPFLASPIPPTSMIPLPDPNQITDPTQIPATLAAWAPVNLAVTGEIPGEGEWLPYLWDQNGNVVAYRTFLNTDLLRPYACVAVVAFDTQATLLHFVLGYEEPVSQIYIPRPARIPAQDLIPGKILAAFNGGFKAQHGHFGVMLDDVVLIPPIAGLGTVAIYSDGRVALGAWGKDISPAQDLIAWRQNGPLIILDGQINPHTNVIDPQVWGYTTSGGTATSRSALGISLDGRILYYAVGFDLTLPALASALQTAGIFQAIQLDINNFYTHFEAFSLNSENDLTVVPLLNQMKGSGDHRYLTINKRDFFYITTR